MFKKSIIILFLFISFVPSQTQDEIIITILYDNHSISDSLETDWGFACLIETPIKKILFDSGRVPEKLQSNFKKLKINDSLLDIIIISHNHSDHTGGLEYLIDKNLGSTIYYPDKEKGKFNALINIKDCKPVPVNKALSLSHCISLTGQMKSEFINEHSLILDTTEGIVIITGCAHQGITNVAQKAKELFEKDIYLILGGFHLVDATIPELKNITETLNSLGVKNIAPSHCTGEKAIKIFKGKFGDNFIESGVGATFKFKHEKRNLY